MFGILFFLIDASLSSQFDPMCEQGGVYNDEARLCMIPLFQGTFYEAESACAARGATLPYVKQRGIDSALTDRNFGPGYTEISFWLGKDPSAYKWLDGTVIDYSNWEPSANRSNITCAGLDKHGLFADEWTPQDCSSTLPIVCTYVPSTRLCPNGLSYIPTGTRGYCYSALYGSHSFFDKSNFATSYTDDLASIHSEAENELVLQLSLSNTTIGDGIVHFWIGRKTNENGTAYRVDGGPNDYLNYDPKVVPGEKNVCTTISLNTGGGYTRGMWYTTDCDNNSGLVTHGAVCKTETLV